MPEVILPNNWQPRDYQLPLWTYLEGGGKRAAAVWHRRAGKDDLALHWTAVAMHERVGTYWHMLPEANQARKAIWDAVNPKTGKKRIDEAFPHEIRSSTRATDMFIGLKCGSTWQVVGSDNFDSLVGSPPIGIVFSEWSIANPRAWAFLRPILLENGGWALFIYTSRGRNHGYTTFTNFQNDPESFAQILPASQTNVFTPEQLARELEEYKADYGQEDGEALFNQEYDCSFAGALVGSFYGKLLDAAERDGRIRDVPWEPTLPVKTSFDLGTNDTTAIWFFQQSGREVWLIDYYETSGQGLEHYAKVLREKPYAYERPFWPHDGGHMELGPGKTRKDQWASLMNGVAPMILPRLPVDDGIQAVRSLLPRCYFDRTKCADGLNALREYRKQWDDERKVFKTTPLHNWASNGSDSFRYLAMGLRVPMDPTKPRQVEAISEENPRGTWATMRQSHAISE